MARNRKKPYSLDYNIVLATDRNETVINILNNLDTTPNSNDLEQMADYILFGKDEKYLSARDRKEITQPKRRFNSYSTKAEKNESLDELMEDPIMAPEIENRIASPQSRYKVFKPEIRRPKYDKEGNLIDAGDSDVPGMIELWERIDTLQERLDMYRGKIPPNDYVRNHPMTEYQIYKFGHHLIDIRRHQYYLKDAYKPVIHFFNVPTPTKIEPNFNCNTGLWLTPQEWCKRKRNPKPFDLEQPALEDAPENELGLLYWKISENEINYENPKHILALLDNYVSLLKNSYDKPDSAVRALCFDIENLVDAANLNDVEQFLLEQRVAHRNIFLIRQTLMEENINLTDTQIRDLMRKKIPQKLANTATKIRLECEVNQGTKETLECSKCHQLLPKDPFYFSRSRDKRTGYCSQCKSCQKESYERRKQQKTLQEVNANA